MPKDTPSYPAPDDDEDKYKYSNYATALLLGALGVATVGSYVALPIFGYVAYMLSTFVYEDFIKPEQTSEPPSAQTPSDHSSDEPPSQLYTPTFKEKSRNTVKRGSPDSPPYYEQDNDFYRPAPFNLK